MKNFGDKEEKEAYAFAKRLCFLRHNIDDGSSAPLEFEYLGLSSFHFDRARPNVRFTKNTQIN